jgi:hypothetical protein
MCSAATLTLRRETGGSFFIDQPRQNASAATKAKSWESASRQWRWLRFVRKLLQGTLGALFVLGCVPANANEGEERWRLSEQGDGALLAATRTDEATDDLGAFFFHCKAKSGVLEVQGTANQELRTAMADLIRTEGYPQVELFPAGSVGASLLNLSYNEMFGAWQYSFTFPAIGPTFDEFKRTGKLVFKVGTAVVGEEFNVGLESAIKFQDICKRPPKRTLGQ